ncbi:MAG: sn-glycerol-1-phosphate dehydrogenase, partial [Pseudomonadota bacterium]
MPEQTSDRDWNAVLSDVVAGRWTDPETGKAAAVPFQSIVIGEDLSGAEADLIAPLGLGERLAVVSDENTVEALG